jgi:hypothetical protein
MADVTEYRLSMIGHTRFRSELSVGVAYVPDSTGREVIGTANACGIVTEVVEILRELILHGHDGITFGIDVIG